MQRNIHGLGAPAHTLMERKIVSYVSTTLTAEQPQRVKANILLTCWISYCDLDNIQNPAFDPTTSSNSISKLHLDILNGDDERIEPRDFLPCKCFSFVCCRHLDIWLADLSLCLLNYCLNTSHRHCCSCSRDLVQPP